MLVVFRDGSPGKISNFWRISCYKHLSPNKTLLFFARHSPQSQVSAIHCKLSPEAGCPCRVRKSVLRFHSLWLWLYSTVLFPTVCGCTLLYSSTPIVALLFCTLPHSLRLYSSILFHTYCGCTLLYSSTYIVAVLFCTLSPLQLYYRQEETVWNEFALWECPPGSLARNTADSFTLSAKLLSAKPQGPGKKSLPHRRRIFFLTSWKPFFYVEME